MGLIKPTGYGTDHDGPLTSVTSFTCVSHGSILLYAFEDFGETSVQARHLTPACDPNYPQVLVLAHVKALENDADFIRIQIV